MHSGLLLLFAVASVVATAHGETTSRHLVPYKRDGHTLHLWHLNEAAPPFRDSANRATPLRGLHNGAKTLQPSHPALGHAISFAHNAGGTLHDGSLRGAIVTSSRQLAFGPEDNAPPSFRYQGRSGAFTYEALVKLDHLPQDAPGINSCILSMDDDIDARIFIFHMEPQGTLAFVPLENCGSDGGALATIPTTGPHAINTTDWFHVAVTYNGKQGFFNNLKLYWTRVASGAEEANLIGSGTLTHDFNGIRGDFAIGNEARSSSTTVNAESDPFPGLLDEIRISSVARHPRDFILTPPDDRVSPEQARSDLLLAPDPNESSLLLAGVLVDLNPVPLPKDRNTPLTLKPGLHRLDFDFFYPTEQTSELTQLRCRLEGVDERWITTARGMSLTFQVRDNANRVISEATFDAVGTSPGWNNSLFESEFTVRSEPYYIPKEGRALYIAMASGSPDTTGSFAIDDLQVTLPGTNTSSLWSNSNFSQGTDLDSPTGVPHRWSRTRGDPTIARISGDPSNSFLTLADANQQQFGIWACRQQFDPDTYAGRTVVISWKEAYNIIGGSVHRASYVNVPAGDYTFRAIGLTGGSSPKTASLSLSISIPPPFWERAWFLPFVTATGVALLAIAIYRNSRRRARRRLRELRFQHDLERDRTRIARDMHDDLGTRISVLNLNGSLALRDIDNNPDNARRHLGKMKASARELVVAMDDLVWAVDPAHDSLDQFASHLTRMAEEMFRDSPIRCRLDIPAILPSQPLESDFRHQLALAVKEALHNVLRHAGPCEVHLSLQYTGTQILIEISDTGPGFEQDPDSTRHGLDNLRRRLEELGGTCVITSAPGKGTSITFTCPLSNNPIDPKP